MENIFRDTPSLRSLFKPGDIFLLDRGFRNCVQYLEQDLGFDVRTPGFLDKGQKQLSYLDANWSRLCTKMRGVIERVFGHLQAQFKLFKQPAENKSLTHDFRDLLNACSILNAFFPDIKTDEGSEEAISKRIQLRLTRPNYLGQMVIKYNLDSKRANFQNINESSVDFPVLTENDLYLIACGRYHIRLAPSYVNDLGKKNLDLQVCKHMGPLFISEYDIQCSEPYLVRGRIHSRFSNTVLHLFYILLDLSKSGFDMISEYYCRCKAGNRTAGCCAHTMVVFWYLGFAKYQSSIPKPASFLDDFFVDLNHSDTDMSDDDND